MMPDASFGPVFGSYFASLAAMHLRWPSGVMVGDRKLRWWWSRVDVWMVVENRQESRQCHGCVTA